MNDNPYDLKQEAVKWGVGAVVLIGLAGLGVWWGRHRPISNPLYARLKASFPGGRFVGHGVWVTHIESPQAIWEWVTQHPVGVVSLETQATESGYRTTIKMVR